MASINAEDTLLFADDGAHALHLLNNEMSSSGLPCLIVLDLNMPKLNGTQTLKQLKEDPRYRDIPVIVYSTSINRVEKEKCLALGAHSFITKPLSLKESRATAQFFYSFCR